MNQMNYAVEVGIEWKAMIDGSSVVIGLNLSNGLFITTINNKFFCLSKTLLEALQISELAIKHKFESVEQF